MQGSIGWAHHAPLVYLGAGLSGQQAGFGDLQVLDDLGDQLLDLGDLARAQGLYHQAGQPQHEFALDHILGDHLVAGMGVAVGAPGPVVAQVNVAVQENPLPGNQHVVEEDDAVHLLESRCQGMIEVRTAQVEAFPAQKFQSRRVARYGESEGVFFL